MMSKQRHMQIIDKRKWRKFRPIAGMKSIFSLCYLINYIYKSVFAKWFRYHVITLVVIVLLNNRVVYMYFYTLSVLDMEAGNFLPAVWYVRITAYDILNITKTNSVMFFSIAIMKLFVIVEINLEKVLRICDSMLSRLFQNETKTLKFTSTIWLSQWSDRESFVVLWIWHRLCFLCNVPKLSPSD